MKKFFSSFPEAFQIMDDHHLNPTVCIHNDLGLYAQGSQSGSRRSSDRSGGWYSGGGNGLGIAAPTGKEESTKR